MSNLLFFGFFLGASHALEIDHVAALGSMSSDKGSTRQAIVLRGAVWGVGHAVMLFLLCCGLTAFGWSVSDRMASALELGVGLMLIWLGTSALLHLIGKRGDLRIADDQHNVNNGQTLSRAKEFPTKALLVGFVHGAAGSSALLALTLAATQNMLDMTSYVALFGLGSILGMAALSFALTLPLGLLRKHRGISVEKVLAGLAALAILAGVSVVGENLNTMILS